MGSKWTFNLNADVAASTGVASVTLHADDINEACNTFVRFMEDAGSLDTVTSVTCDIDVSEEARERAASETHTR